MQIDCLAFVAHMKDTIRAQIAALGIPLQLVVVNVGDDPASKSYIKSKVKMGAELGINVRVEEFADLSEAELLERVTTLNNDQDVHGIIVQLPLPTHLPTRRILNAIDPGKDVDCLTDANYAAFLMNRNREPGLAPCTALGIYRLLEWLNFPFDGANAVVINRSDIVGRPLAHLLLNANSTITVGHSHTRDWRFYTRHADLIVLGVGHQNFLRLADVRPGATIIDVSINRDPEGKLHGDAVFPELVTECDITPVPRGIGPITVVMIFQNLLHLVQAAHGEPK